MEEATKENINSFVNLDQTVTIAMISMKYTTIKYLAQLKPLFVKLKQITERCGFILIRNNDSFNLNIG